MVFYDLIGLLVKALHPWVTQLTTANAPHVTKGGGHLLVQSCIYCRGLGDINPHLAMSFVNILALSGYRNCDFFAETFSVLHS